LFGLFFFGDFPGGTLTTVLYTRRSIDGA